MNKDLNEIIKYSGTHMSLIKNIEIFTYRTF